MSPSPAKILIVDDDVALLEALPETLRLRMPEAVVDTADSAEAALERIASVDYDAIVTDIKMPGIDGLALLDRIREVRRDTPTLIMTGHGEHDLAVRSLRGGAYDYVQKPIDREYLLASLARAVHVRRLRREVAEQQRALEQRAATLEQTIETRTLELRQTADRLRVLSEAATSIHSARDVAQILHAVTEAARHLSGAGVAIAGCSRVRPRAAAEDPAAWELAIAPSDARRWLGVPHVAALLGACAHQKGHRHVSALPQPLDPQLPWAIGVPLQSREEDLRGAIIVGHHEPPPFAEDLQIQVGALARQAAVALENALLYQRERGIAETLQRSLLPGQLPQIPGLALDARYLPGRPDAVGGDWYDVFPLPSGHVGLAMGDVAGRGVWAAAVMGQLRNALRAFAIEGNPPAQVGERLNRFIPPGTMATLIYLVLDPDTLQIRYVNLGHLPPLVVTPQRTVSFLEGGGAPPLGATFWRGYCEGGAVLEPDSTLVLYTDGLVERRGVSIDDGLGRLAHAIAAKSNGNIAGLLDHVLAQVLGGDTGEDDVAVLALRALPIDRTRLALRLPAVPTSLHQLRQTLRRWLGMSQISPGVVDEITTACCEACANAIEHAYGPGDASFSIDADLIDGHMSLTVQDAGRWRPPRGIHRGFGLTIMRELMDTVDVQSGPGGTTVQMRRRVLAKRDA